MRQQRVLCSTPQRALRAGLHTRQSSVRHSHRRVKHCERFCCPPQPRASFHLTHQCSHAERGENETLTHRTAQHTPSTRRRTSSGQGKGSKVGTNVRPKDPRHPAASVLLAASAEGVLDGAGQTLQRQEGSISGYVGAVSYRAQPPPLARPPPSTCRRDFPPLPQLPSLASTTAQ